jgi:DNA modification methylase
MPTLRGGDNLSHDLRSLTKDSPFVKVLTGDVQKLLPELEDDSIDCVVTSPPYWGLRDYGVDGQIGMEPTPEEYISKLTGVFHEIKRILRPKGTLWLNIGDSYSASSNTGGTASFQKAGPMTTKGHGVPKGLKPKNLVGIPWRLALSLQSDGWYLRSDIIWSKSNPMPESVIDRPTKSHEYIFLLTKSESYFYDMEAVKERATYQDDRVRDRDSSKLNHTPGKTRSSGLKTNHYDFRNIRTVWNFNSQPFPDAHFAVFPEELPTRCIKAGCPAGGIVLDPFAGSGTTGAVARALGRSSISIELNPEYVKLIEGRTDSKVPALTAFGVS